jgi:chromosome segregation ATPase
MNIPVTWILVGSMIAISGSYAIGHHNGWNDRDAEMQIQIAKKNAEAREKEQKLNAEINANATKLAEANNAITEKQTALDRAIRAGRVRISTPTSCVPAPASAPAPTGDRDEAPSESERQTLAAIAALIAEADRHINQLNACIDSYNKVREQLNGSR